ncbi:MAG: IclR family transcriptional regulator [Geminicoccaceae bacterium]
MNDAGRGSGIQVIARAASILRALREDTSGMSLGQIADKVDLPRSTVQRIVRALQVERLVISSNSGGSIRLGPEITALSDATRYNVIELCRPPLQDLSETLGETVDLSVLRGHGMIFLDQVLGTHRLRTVSAIGEVFPLTTTANGRAVLAMMDREQARSLVVDEWKRLGIDGDWKGFETKIEAIQASGLAYDVDEHTEGISAIGAGFSDATGQLHAVSVPIPSTRFHEKRRAIEDALRSTLLTLRDLVR